MIGHITKTNKHNYFLYIDYVFIFVSEKMTKLKRQRARKKFNYSTNRRRVRDKREKNSKFNVKVRRDVNVCMKGGGSFTMFCQTVLISLERG